MSDLFLSTTGFVFPANNQFVQYVPETKVDISITKRLESNVDAFAKTSTIYYSPSANKAHSDYLVNKDFNSYVSMLNIASEVLSGLSLLDFASMQATNKYLSSVGNMVCCDLLDGVWFNTHNRYQAYPSDSRIDLTRSGDVSYTAHKSLRLSTLIKNYGRDSSCLDLLSYLYGDKQAFEAFFKYVFVDKR